MKQLVLVGASMDMRYSAWSKSSRLRAQNKALPSYFSVSASIRNKQLLYKLIQKLQKSRKTSEHQSLSPAHPLPKGLQLQFQRGELIDDHELEHIDAFAAEEIIVQVESEIADEDVQGGGREDLRGDVYADLAALPGLYAQEVLQVALLAAFLDLASQLAQHQLRKAQILLVLHFGEGRARLSKEVLDACPALGDQHGKALRKLTHFPGLQGPQFHISGHFNLLISVNQHNKGRGKYLIDVFEQQSQRKQSQSLIGILQIYDSSCEIDPKGYVVLYIVQYELEEAEGEDGLAVVHYELFLEGGFVARVQATSQLAFKGLAAKQVAQVCVVRGLDQPRVVEEFRKGHAQLLVPDQHSLDEISSLRGNLSRKLYRFLGCLNVLLLSDFLLLRIEERVASEEQFIGDDAKAPNIAFFIILFFFVNLRGHCQRRAYD